MQALLRDVRYGIRSLLKAPGLTAVAVLALTLGIGLTTTMFSIVYGALMKGLPYPDGDRIVIVNRSNTARGINQSGALDSRLRRLQGAAALLLRARRRSRRARSS